MPEGFESWGLCGSSLASPNLLHIRNPALLFNLPPSGFCFSAALLPGNLQRFSAFLFTTIKNLNLGLWLSSLSTRIDYYDQSGELVGKAYFGDYLVRIGGNLKVSEKISVGLSVGSIVEVLMDSPDTAPFIDLGILFKQRLFLQPFDIAAGIMNWGGCLFGDIIPRTIYTSFSTEYKFLREDFTFYYLPDSQIVDVKLGLSATFWDRINLRTGFALFPVRISGGTGYIIRLKLSPKKVITGELGVSVLYNFNLGLAFSTGINTFW